MFVAPAALTSINAVRRLQIIAFLPEKRPEVGLNLDPLHRRRPRANGGTIVQKSKAIYLLPFRSPQSRATGFGWKLQIKFAETQAMSLQVWSDNETDQDLLGFQVHADLIRSVVTDERVLPIVLGVFGDWGGGKSSIMRMVQRDLGSPVHENTVCLYFNGWMFEGYEDAKTALLSSILIQLGEHKTFGPKVKDKVVGLLKRVKWMEVAKLSVKHVVVPLGAALLTGGTSAVLAAGSALAQGVASRLTAHDPDSANESGKENQTRWSDLIEADPGKPDVLEVRKFREDFAAMLAKTDIQSLVILIDDLDRCLPERIIDTLEAIKLFVAVEKTAFVIGADPRIVRHAIATRYVKPQVAGDALSTAEEQYDLVKDYLEKLIQIPYHLPRLSPSEIESYVNLLACQKALKESEYKKVLEHWQSCRKKNMYAAYREGAICEALGGASAVPPELLAELSWSNAIADVVTDGLKGNPRQVKRMLNAMALRKQLASVAEIKVRDDVLAKLMVLEYSNLHLLQELSQWQATAYGFPEKLKALEGAAIEGSAAKAERPEDVSKEWLKPTAQNWLRMQPGLSDVDLRDYFWLARDRTNSTLSGVSLVAPVVRRLFDSLISDNKGEQALAVKGCGELSDAERAELLAMLSRQIERHPDQVQPQDALLALAEAKIIDAGTAMIRALKASTRSQVQPAAAFRLKTLVNITGDHQSAARALLELFAKDTTTPLGRAALKQLQ
jgi:predicted KAP-like P-loop ATPase